MIILTVHFVKLLNSIKKKYLVLDELRQMPETRIKQGRDEYLH